MATKVDKKQVRKGKPSDSEMKAPSKPTRETGEAAVKSARRIPASRKAKDKAIANDNGSIAEVDDAGVNPIDKPVKKTTKNEAKPSKTQTKGAKRKPEVPVDADGEEQQETHDQEVSSEIRTPTTILAADLNKNPAKSKKTILFIGRRQARQRGNVELLLWDGEFDWILRTYAVAHYKAALDEYDVARKSGRVREVDVPGYHAPEILERVRLVGGTEPTPSPSRPAQSHDTNKTEASLSTTKNLDADNEKSNEDEAVQDMLVYILEKVLQPDSWLVFPETGSYQFATDRAKAWAEKDGYKEAPELVEKMLRLGADGIEPYGKHEPNLVMVQVAWVFANQQGEDEAASEAEPTGEEPWIEVSQLWEMFFSYFTSWQDQKDRPSTPWAEADQREFGSYLITDSPHIALTSSWPYLIALALLTKDEAKKAEIEAGLTPSDARHRETVHACMTQYQQDRQIDYPRAVHIYYLLQKLLRSGGTVDIPREKKPLGHPTIDPDTQSGKENEVEEESGDPYKSDAERQKSGKNDLAQPESKRDRRPRGEKKKEGTDDAGQQLERDEIEEDDTESGEVAAG